MEVQRRLLGRPLHDWPARYRACTLAWLWQGESVMDDLSALDVALLSRQPHQPGLGALSAEDLAAVERALRPTQASDWRSRPMGRLSDGVRQRVLLARTLAVQVPVLLMDEPLLHRDPPPQADRLTLVYASVAGSGTVASVPHQDTCDDAATHAALIYAFNSRLAVRPLDGHWVALPH